MNQRVPPESEPASNSATPTEVRPNQRDLRGRVIRGTESERRMLALRDQHPNSAEELLRFLKQYAPGALQRISAALTKKQPPETEEPKN